MRAKVVEAESTGPDGDGRSVSRRPSRVMDYYRMKNVQPTPSMRESIAGRTNRGQKRVRRTTMIAATHYDNLLSALFRNRDFFQILTRAVKGRKRPPTQAKIDIAATSIAPSFAEEDETDQDRIRKFLEALGQRQLRRHRRQSHRGRLSAPIVGLAKGARADQRKRSVLFATAPFTTRPPDLPRRNSSESPPPPPEPVPVITTAASEAYDTWATVSKSGTAKSTSRAAKVDIGFAERDHFARDFRTAAQHAAARFGGKR